MGQDNHQDRSMRGSFPRGPSAEGDELQTRSLRSGEETERARDAGARSYLVKPVSRDFLRPMLSDAVAMGELIRVHNHRATGEKD